MAPPASELAERIASRTALVGVVGLGYVGLPLVRVFVDAGFRVLGFDTDADKVARLTVGESYIGHIPGQWIADARANERFAATADMARLAEPDAILICVPTPLNDDKSPDLRYVEATTRQIADRLRSGQLVVLESTTYPGTTRDVVLPILARAERSVGRDFLLAYSPEREDPGNPIHSTSDIPKLVGGIEPISLQMATALYSAAVKHVVPVSSCEVAEAAKLLENTYRAVNIALVNELKKVFSAMGIDVWEVIAAARTKPFGFQAFEPGPGLGGHCIPIDPFYLSWLARAHGTESRFIELAGEVNTTMPEYVVEQVEAALGERGHRIGGSKICILGVAYKRDVDDPRESPAFRLIELLADRGATISYSDPHVATLPKMRNYRVPELCSSELTPEFLADQDCVLIVTDHTAFNFPFIVQHARLVVDTRNATRNVADGREKIRKA